MLATFYVLLKLVTNWWNTETRRVWHRSKQREMWLYINY